MPDIDLHMPCGLSLGHGGHRALDLVARAELHGDRENAQTWQKWFGAAGLRDPQAAMSGAYL